jgi:ADP-ribose pyrophosphatase YjhB (NUDIX family)
MFALITGFMEAGETPQEGIAREIKEETNLDTSAVNLIGVYDFQRMNQVIIAYHAVADGEVACRPSWWSTSCTTLQDVKCWPAGTGYALADWLRTRGHEPRVRGIPRGKTEASPKIGPLPKEPMNIDKELDTRGLNCPLPILKAKKALTDMQRGSCCGGVHRRRLAARLSGVCQADRQRAGRAADHGRGFHPRAAPALTPGTRYFTALNPA